MGAAELTESLCLPAIANIPVGLYVPLLEFNLSERVRIERLQSIVGQAKYLGRPVRGITKERENDTLNARICCNYFVECAPRTKSC